MLPYTVVAPAGLLEPLEDASSSLLASISSGPFSMLSFAIESPLGASRLDDAATPSTVGPGRSPPGTSFAEDAVAATGEALAEAGADDHVPSIALAEAGVGVLMFSCLVWLSFL